MTRTQSFFYKLARSSAGAKTAFGGSSDKRTSFFDFIGLNFLGFLFSTLAAALATGLYGAVALIPALSFLPDLTTSGFLTATLALSLLGTTLITGAFLQEELTILSTPKDADPEVNRAWGLARSIKKKAEKDLIRNDPEALALARGACELYDDFVLNISKLAKMDPAGFPRTLAEARNGGSKDAYVAWLVELLDSVATLKQVDDDLEELLNNQARSDVLKARQAALDLAQHQKANSTKSNLKDNLEGVRLREEIKKKSMTELEEHLKALEAH